MQKVLNRIWIDGYAATRDDFDAVVSITIHPVAVDGAHYQYKIADGKAWNVEEQKNIVRFLWEHRLDDRILIHCDAGISRSTSALVLWLMAVGFGKEPAVQFIKSRYARANPNRAILNSLEYV